MRLLLTELNFGKDISEDQFGWMKLCQTEILLQMRKH